MLSPHPLQTHAHFQIHVLDMTVAPRESDPPPLSLWTGLSPVVQWVRDLLPPGYILSNTLLVEIGNQYRLVINHCRRGRQASQQLIEHRAQSWPIPLRNWTLVQICRENANSNNSLLSTFFFFKWKVNTVCLWVARFSSAIEHWHTDRSAKTNSSNCLLSKWGRPV